MLDSILNFLQTIFILAIGFFVFYYGISISGYLLVSFAQWDWNIVDSYYMFAFWVKTPIYMQPVKFIVTFIAIVFEVIMWHVARPI